MTNEEIQRIALSHGFKLKEQPDGSLALNPYVFEFANTLLYTVIPKLVKANGLIENLKIENERLQAEVKLSQASERKAAENNVKLIEESFKLKKDAERYRWLREDDNWEDDGDAWLLLGEKSHLEFDEFIDAAMREAK